ncbi:MAG: carboxylating nicotinate-nucleotide diphosphorylase [Thermoanaerobaculia bacterium]|nr:carboxylating nicotinate-nucleotide diphosphorylase [Thermoanaerobaculia bacterium]
MTEPARLLPLHLLQYEDGVRAALIEDLGHAGDLTSNATIPDGLRWRGAIVARQPGVVAGLDVARTAFRLIEPTLSFEGVTRDGEEVVPGDTLATIEGAARGILSAERVALNYLGHLSGIASTTARLVAAVGASHARIVCTRKTTPGLRALEKYAVRAGGGANHRFGLDDAVLIKDNHLAVAGSVTAALARVRERVGHMVKVEIEVDTLDQLDEALECGVDAVLLDNMAPTRLRQAVERVAGRAITEASGGITEATVGPVAATGVDLISVGWITHSAPCLDLGLDFDA